MGFMGSFPKVNYTGPRRPRILECLECREYRAVGLNPRGLRYANPTAGVGWDEFGSGAHCRVAQDVENEQVFIFGIGFVLHFLLFSAHL